MQEFRTQAEILATHSPALFAEAVQRAAALLRSGGVVALPTETVYGLAANALDPIAVGKIYEIKGRPASNPIIIHVASLDMARRYAAHWPEQAGRLAREFWPGPLTLVVPRSKEVPDCVTAGGETVGIRWPSHPLMQAVIRECGFPLAAPSANLSNAVSPTNASHVARILGARIELILDGGQAQVGIESTVLDVSVHPPRLLRPGMIHADALRRHLGDLAREPEIEPAGSLRSPGLLARHYSPRARLMIIPWDSEDELKSALSRLGVDPKRSHVIAHTRIPLGGWLRGVSVIPLDAEAYARGIYAELHQSDQEGTDWIVVEPVPEGPEWQGIKDRLKRGSAASPRGNDTPSGPNSG